MKILTIVGARPQFVKASVVSRAILRYNSENSTSSISESILHTGQHYDPGMSDVFFEQMEIPRPHVNLHVGSGLQGAVTGEMLKGIEAEIVSQKPDLVLVYGDTNSTLAGALAAAKLHVPIAHVEAGLRSFNMRMPEEVNRVLTDRISSFLFCPSTQSVQWLKDENIKKNVHDVGDVMFDAFLHYLPKAQWPEGLNRPQAAFALSTLHRAENTDHIERLEEILAAFSNSGIEIICPIHPRTKKVLEQARLSISKNIHLIPPQPYFSMLGLLKECNFVLTDSGGLQKEAYFAGKKTVTLRDETEWIELVEVGANKLVGAQRDAIQQGIQWAQSSTSRLDRPIYGNGHAGDLIVKILAQANV